MQKCGLCSILTRLLRRAMCVGSRRGSGESYYQELASTMAPDGIPTQTADSSIYIRLIPSTSALTISAKMPSIQSTADQLKDQLNLDDLTVLNNTRGKHMCNGRFLTMHKRRRKKLTTRQLSQEIAILDDIQHGLVQCILNQIGDWHFNAFTLENVTGGRSLPVLCVHLFHWYGLLDYFKLDVVRLWKLFTLVEEGYHSTNPYHNSIHATDVTQAMHCFLQQRNILEHLKPIEIMASLIGAVTHDLDHPGVNQPFLIATANHLAALYENTSVLENHHWRSAIGCLLESGIAEQINDIRPEVERQIASLILATDITRQQEFLIKLRRYLDTNSLDMRHPDKRHFILQISLKCADISNPCRPWDVSKKWSTKVCEEFFRQGDYERQLNLPITSCCDRFTTSVPKIQVGFFKFVVTPLFDEWHRFLDNDLSHKMMHHLKYNQIQWENKVAQELAEETRTEISDTELLEVEEEEDIGECDDQAMDISNSSEILLPMVSVARRSSLQIPTFRISQAGGRRHSVPANPPKIKLLSGLSTTDEIIREDAEMRFDPDALSLFSSGSNSLDGLKSSDNSRQIGERPLSAENLLPDLNIASMTDSTCADRLNEVMHGASRASNSASKSLIRQQTFPPLQPYIRARYLSATTEIGIGIADSRNKSNSSSSDSSSGDMNQQERLFKELEMESRQSERASKLLKLSSLQKENMDPSIITNISSHRRSSAPLIVAMPPKTDESFTFLIHSSEKYVRRGSMPVKVEKDSIKNGAKSSTTSCAFISSAFRNVGLRRCSVPCESISGSNGNGKSRNRKILLRRRASGGTEILNPMQESKPSASKHSLWYRFKRDRTELDARLSTRRGSLPV